MAKPTQLPRWATGAGAVITPEPNEGKKDSGWSGAGEKPPYQYFNWWMRRVYDWCLYLDGLTNETLTWAAKHTFAAGLASSVAPASANDVVRLADGVSTATASAFMRRDASGRAKVADPAAATDIDTQGARDTAITAAGAAAATPSKFVLRDASGRAKVADPAAATDIDTKGAREAAIALPTETTGSFTAGTGWSVSSQVLRRRGHTVFGALTLTAAGGGSYSSGGVLGGGTIATVPAGFRPAQPTAVWGLIQVVLSDESVGIPCIFRIQTNGALVPWKFLSAGQMTYDAWPTPTAAVHAAVLEELGWVG